MKPKRSSFRARKVISCVLPADALVSELSRSPLQAKVSRLSTLAFAIFCGSFCMEIRKKQLSLQMEID